jgi:hypothetical protein
MDLKQEQQLSPRAVYEQQQKQQQGCDFGAGLAAARSKVAPVERSPYGRGEGRSSYAPVGGPGALLPRAPRPHQSEGAPDKWSALELTMISGGKTGGGYVPPHMRRPQPEEAAPVEPDAPPEETAAPPAPPAPLVAPLSPGAALTWEVAQTVRSVADLAVLLEIKEEHLALLAAEEYDLHSLKVSSDDDLKSIGLPKGVRMKLLKWAKAVNDAH